LHHASRQHAGHPAKKIEEKICALTISGYPTVCTDADPSYDLLSNACLKKKEVQVTSSKRKKGWLNKKRKFRKRDKTMLRHEENKLRKRQIMRVIKNKYHKVQWYVAENMFHVLSIIHYSSRASCFVSLQGTRGWGAGRCCC
jgi:hypothetical protein